MKYPQKQPHRQPVPLPPFDPEALIVEAKDQMEEAKEEFKRPQSKEDAIETVRKLKAKIGELVTIASVSFRKD